MKKLLAALIVVASLPLLGRADTVTSRLSLTEPDVNSANWGTKLNNNFGLIDAGAGVLAKTNTWTGTNNFTGPINISSYTTITSSVAFSTITIQSGVITVSSLTVTSSATVNYLSVTTATFSSASASTMTVTSSATVNVLGVTGSVNVPLTLTSSETVRGNFGIIGTVTQPLTASSSMTINSGAYLGANNSSVVISSNFVTFGATFYANAPAVISTTVQFTSGNGILGTTTNDNACVGCYGQYVSSAEAATVNFPPSATYGDIGTISLGAGDWDISTVLRINLNSITTVGSQIVEGISTTSGNSSTGLVFGTNTCDYVPGGYTNTDIETCSIPSWRVQPTVTTTYYHKYQAAYSGGGPPTVIGYRISARRIR